MPKGSGFFSQTKNLGLQGSWYWFDEGPKGDVTKVRIDVPNGESSAPGDTDVTVESLLWFDAEDYTRQAFTNENTVERICIEGDVTEYLALGFEVCSTKRDQEPYEFPAPLGRCYLDEPIDAVRKFKGVVFDVALASPEFFKIEVEFKQWGPPDMKQPKCSIYRDPADADGNEPPCESKPLDTSKTRIRVTADSAAVLSDMQVSRLQAIHILVYKANKGEKASFEYCLSRVFALYDQDAVPVDTYTAYADPDPFDTGCKEMDTSEFPDSPDSEGVQQIEGETGPVTIQWVPLDTDVEETAWIMRTEVTVGAYLACNQTGPCNNTSANWESCNGSDAGVVAEDTEWPDKAVNCVDWCQAQAFCTWVGGRLPSKLEWEAALEGAGGSPGSPAGNDCDYIVMQDEELGYGIGCGHRMPASVCSKVSDTNPGRLCDMYGNLWEWLADPAEPDALSPSGGISAESYMQLIGGSLNTVTTDTFQRNWTTVEHRTVPHSPTRLGFRCFLPKPGSR